MRLKDEELKYAAELTIEEWPEASKMPPLQFILERAGRYSPPTVDDASRILSRGDKPADWDPDWAKDFLRTLREKKIS